MKPNIKNVLGANECVTVMALHFQYKLHTVLQSADFTLCACENDFY